MAMDALMAAETAVRSARPVLNFDEARRLADRFGTPLLAISCCEVVQQFRSLQAALPDVELFYAVKANPDPIILNALASAGCSADVCTFHETQWAQAAGFTPQRMIHTHPCKAPRDIAQNYQSGVRWFTFDSHHELPKLAKHAPTAKLLLRLAAPRGSSVIDLSSKFGASPHDARLLAQEARRWGLSVGGLSFHVGSQATEPDDFVPALAAARRAWAELSEAGCPLEVLDIGGGFPAPYRSPVMTRDAYCHRLRSALSDSFGDLDIRIIAEPGRALVAEAVTLIASVLGKSVRAGCPWYYLDDGLYGSFSGKAFDHADFPLLVEAADTRPAAPCIVAGPTCDSGDVVSRDQPLPDLQVGELVLVPTMGAYTSASATHFNGLPPARSVALD